MRSKFTLLVVLALFALTAGPARANEWSGLDYRRAAELDQAATRVHGLRLLAGVGGAVATAGIIVAGTGWPAVVPAVLGILGAVVGGGIIGHAKGAIDGVYAGLGSLGDTELRFLALSAADRQKAMAEILAGDDPLGSPVSGGSNAARTARTTGGSPQRSPAASVGAVGTTR